MDSEYYGEELDWQPVDFGIVDATAQDGTYLVFEAEIQEDFNTSAVIKGHTPDGRHFTSQHEADWPTIEKYIPRNEWPSAVEGSQIEEWHDQDVVLRYTMGEVDHAAAWRRRQAELAAPSLTVYTVPSCPGCEMTKKQLDAHGVDFEVVDLSENPELVEQFKKEGLLAAPIIESADGVRTSGFKPERIRSLIAASKPAHTQASQPNAGNQPSNTARRSQSNTQGRRNTL